MFCRLRNLLFLTAFFLLLCAFSAHAESVAAYPKAVGSSPSATILVYGSARESATQRAMTYLSAYASYFTPIHMNVEVRLLDAPEIFSIVERIAAQMGWNRITLKAGDDGTRLGNLGALGLANRRVASPQIFVINQEGQISYCTAGALNAAKLNALVSATVSAGAGMQMQLGPEKLTLYRGRLAAFRPVLTPKFSTSLVRYASSDPKIVLVAQSGAIKGMSYGTAVITASVGDVVRQCEVTVTDPLLAIQLSGTSVTLDAGTTHTLSIANLVPFNAAVDVKNATWASTNVQVARVENGVVTALTPGAASIVCRLNGRVAVCAVRVRAVLNVDAPLEEQVLFLVNELRILAGSRPLTNYAPLAQSARIRAEEISRSFSHTRPNGQSCFTALTFRISYAAENIAMGFRTPTNVVNGWMASPSHKKALLNNVYRESGIGIYQKNNVYYWVQMFATRR